MPVSVPLSRISMRSSSDDHSADQPSSTVKESVTWSPVPLNAATGLRSSAARAAPSSRPMVRTPLRNTAVGRAASRSGMTISPVSKPMHVPAPGGILPAPVPRQRSKPPSVPPGRGVGSADRPTWLGLEAGSNRPVQPLRRHGHPEHRQNPLSGLPLAALSQEVPLCKAPRCGGHDAPASHSAGAPHRRALRSWA